ncbi:hypothetical protein [Alcaligenes endophyticus]|uniref:Uncharacterized protein n=1 Tax=Alcaligenes endophyticus TaxID=1929088 RepID=A0ABT8EKD7_9BURK|nr:hypothetical protein [Alcaligenes endophyticus]MCX5590884.1 hypothetical protein [Alcaligenes endophyticus]MDN4121753.1 hypothetical protein [Alcaligenes endophyticus]
MRIEICKHHRESPPRVEGCLACEYEEAQQQLQRFNILHSRMMAFVRNPRNADRRTLEQFRAAFLEEFNQAI